MSAQVRSAIALATTLAMLSPARGDDLGRTVALLPAYQAECAACHVAYPPTLLPASSWRRLMAGLPRHFGVDASVDAATLRQLSSWLEAHAGTADRGAGAPPEDRITRSGWFVREHDELPPSVWRRPSVGSLSNCVACHARADQGVFDEHDVRIPH